MAVPLELVVHAVQQIGLVLQLLELILELLLGALHLRTDCLTVRGRHDPSFADSTHMGIGGH